MGGQCSGSGQAEGRGVIGLICPALPSRSASMRLPAGTVKLGEKLERYHTAIQVGRALAEGPRDLTGLLGGGLGASPSRVSRLYSLFPEIGSRQVSRLVPH